MWSLWLGSKEPRDEFQQPKGVLDLFCSNSGPPCHKENCFPNWGRVSKGVCSIAWGREDGGTSCQKFHKTSRPTLASLNSFSDLCLSKKIFILHISSTAYCSPLKVKYTHITFPEIPHATLGQTHPTTTIQRTAMKTLTAPDYCNPCTQEPVQRCGCGRIQREGGLRRGCYPAIITMYLDCVSQLLKLPWIYQRPASLLVSVYQHFVFNQSVSYK